MYYDSYATGATFDWTYLIILAVLFIASMIAQSAVQKRYKQYSKVFARSGITGAEAARRIMEANSVLDVQILQKGGQNLSDYYDPRSNTIHLSSNTYQSPSVSAIGVACHESGHAIQYAKNYSPVKLRMAMIPVSNTCSKLAIPLILIGFILSGFAEHLRIVALIGIILYAVAVFVQLVTLPVEFDASRRALANIRSCGILAEDEAAGAKRVLTAAAMTYVVAMLTSAVQLIRLISMYNRRR